MIFGCGANWDNNSASYIKFFLAFSKRSSLSIRDCDEWFISSSVDEVGDDNDAIGVLVLVGGGGTQHFNAYVLDEEDEWPCWFFTWMSKTRPKSPTCSKITAVVMSCEPGNFGMNRLLGSCWRCCTVRSNLALDWSCRTPRSMILSFMRSFWFCVFCLKSNL